MNLIMSTVVYSLLKKITILKPKGYVVSTHRLNERLYECVDEDVEYELWDHGEVAWDFKFPLGDESQPIVMTPLNKTFIVDSKYQASTPLSKKMDIDQTSIASLNAMLYATRKEFKRSDILLYNVQAIFDHNNHIVLTPMEICIFAYLSSISYGYEKIKELETMRINRLYNNDRKTSYYKKYDKIRRFVSFVFIFMSVLLVRNIKNAM
jgi:hypothetical protein